MSAQPVQRIPPGARGAEARVGVATAAEQPQVALAAPGVPAAGTEARRTAVALSLAHLAVLLVRVAAVVILAAPVVIALALLLR